MKDTMISNFCVNACEAANTDHPYVTSDVCDLAHELLVTMHPEIGPYHIESPEGVFLYTNTSQKLFDAYYDEIEAGLVKLGLEYNDCSSTWRIKSKAVDKSDA